VSLKSFAAGLLLLPALVFGQVQPNTATITFNTPVSRLDGSSVQGAVSYRVYQGLRGQVKALVGTITSTSQTINSGLIGGNEYCWEVTATEASPGSNTESARSNEGCKAFVVAGLVPVIITVQ
jgi:hypothetical protein